MSTEPATAPSAAPGFASRVIARLDIKGPNLVKGIHLEGLRVMGDPAEHALRYYHGAFEPWPWTYADYREPALREFLEGAREALFQRVLQLRALPSSSDSH